MPAREEHAIAYEAPTATAVIAFDIGKNSFHIVGLDDGGAMVLRQEWSRGQVETRLANMRPWLIGMEAYVGAHHLGRRKPSGPVGVFVAAEEVDVDAFAEAAEGGEEPLAPAPVSVAAHAAQLSLLGNSMTLTPSYSPNTKRN